MKKLIIGFLAISVSLGVCIFGYNYRHTLSPNLYYKVYLNNEVLGVISSKDKLEKFINAESENVKNKYNVDNVFAPSGLVIEKLSSYDQEVMDVSEVYRQIISKSDLTIDGYQINIKNDDKSTTIYVTEEELFKNATIDLIKTFVGSDKYNLYISNRQDKINETGSIVENIYIQNDITIKQTRIPVSEKIYTTVSDLSRFLLYGSNYETSQYIVKVGDTISSVALANQISTEEFLISNPNFTDKTNLLHVGESVTIAVTNPQMQVVMEEYQVVDKESAYITEEQYDSSLYVGTTKVIQEGENGIVRVSQNVQTINGSITYIEPVSKEEIKQAITRITLVGTHMVPNVGDVKNWAWPSNSGYTITDDFEWRINPITGAREHHSGIDITGTGYGSPVYAANNGTVITKKYQSDYGNYITINHNNGYWTVYAHMSRFAPGIEVGSTVARGQLIGYVGSSGWATGPHLHYEVWKNCQHCRINPLSLYR